MAHHLNRFEVFSYLNGGTFAGKWMLKDEYDFLSVTSTRPYESRSYRAFYEEDGSLVFTNVQNTIPKKTSTKLTSHYDLDGTTLLLELALFMMSTGALAPTELANILSPTR